MALVDQTCPKCVGGEIQCKMWARDQLFESCGGDHRRVWLLGGWYGVLAAMLFEDSRFAIGSIESIDIDPHVGTVAASLNKAWGTRFAARTSDMYDLDYAGERPDLVINTSCEHIADVPAFLALLPRGTRVLLQSNDYFSEPTHINCVPSLEGFAAQARLSQVEYSGALKMPKYTRFMLIGRT